MGGSGPGRYSYDVVPGQGGYWDDQENSFVSELATLSELNQFNGRVTYDVAETWELGVSAQIGGFYNKSLNEIETSTAFAGHLVGDFGNFNLKAEYVTYDYNTKSNNGNALDVIQMGAYGYEYFGAPDELAPHDEGYYSGGVAAEANMYLVGLAYSLPVEWAPISSLQTYVDYTLIDKTHNNFHDTHHLVPGILIITGNIYTYIDYAIGKNQPWLTGYFGQGLGTGVENAEWNKRFNINIGYYF